MHHIYTTPAFVIHSAPYGESGKFLLLFTRDFGMIGATAQGIRLLQSKLRYHIQDYSFINVSIVRGKDIWRITGAHEIKNDKNHNILHIKIFKLLKRLVQGEEKNDRLFDIVENFVKTKIENDKADCVEYITVLRILNILGYIKNNNDIDFLLKDNIISDDYIELTNNKKNQILNVINSAFKESQL